MHHRFPLSALLSFPIVAFTIECDNEAERGLAHRTTKAPANARDPWLTSLVMYLNCLRFVSDEGISVGDVERLARTPPNWNGMERWGYISLAPPPGAKKKTPRSQWLARPTAVGRKAREYLPQLLSAIEDRWPARFGQPQFDRLRAALPAIVSQMDPQLPECLPILGYGLTGKQLSRGRVKADHLAAPDPATLPIISLLSKPLLAFALEFESESDVSLAIGANVLRLAGAEPLPIRELPRLSGVSKEAIAVASGFLQKLGFAVVDWESPGSRFRALRLTSKGVAARQTYFRLTSEIEERWKARFGHEKIDALRSSLEEMSAGTDDFRSPLFRGLEPHPGCWRFAIPRAERLPHCPMVLHRGGYPDGS